MEEQDTITLDDLCFVDASGWKTAMILSVEAIDWAKETIIVLISRNEDAEFLYEYELSPNAEEGWDFEEFLSALYLVGTYDGPEAAYNFLITLGREVKKTPASMVVV